MKIEDLINFKIDSSIINSLKQKGINELYEYQKECLKFIDSSYIISAPTNSGKTLLTILSIAKELEKNNKVVYCVPLVALANEKFEEFKNIFKNYKVAISVGDYDSADDFLIYYDIIITTYEKLDSLIRHEANWISQVGLIIIDEIHLLNDFHRGPTLEFLIMKIKKIIPNIKIIGLSATIKNVEEIANWLNINFYKTDFRPVNLYEGVLLNNYIYLNNYKKIKLKENGIEGLIKTLLDKDKQILIFCSTRKEAENLAKKLSEITKKYVREDLTHFSKEILNALEVPTEQCRKLSELLKNGIAFHHAGLVYKQRKIIEDLFRNKKIRVLVSTTTLSMGLNLPSFCVLIANYQRFESGKKEFISNIEYKQMVGRAGRVPYDKFGIGLLFAKTKAEAKMLFKRYIFGDLEEIISKIGNEVILRSQILSLISSNFVKDEKELVEFLKTSFFYYQTKNKKFLETKSKEIIKLLKNWKFIEEKEKELRATRIGKRVSELYIDPLSAKILINGIQKINEETKEILIFQLISSTTEMKFLVNVRDKEYEKLLNFYYSNLGKFLIEIPNEFDLEFEYFLPTFKLSLILDSWINEKNEDEILKEFKITPGELRGILEIADWMLYSLHELALLLGKLEILKKIKKLRIRVKYGIKEELIPLIRIEGIGKARARKLYNYGIRTIEQLRKIPLATLSLILGPKTAEKVKSIVGDEKLLNQKILKDLKIDYRELE
ncbi:MAG: DEAD/DEAH box helicase [Candidatus Aenigmarchaeota archaeon]|nr:DEAD/DEAH box helicase [Candidatus Aenigmarchaeota archaeon]